MNRTNTLIKLLSLGSLPYSEILLIMGGNRDDAVESLSWLVDNGVIARHGSGYNGIRYSLACEL